MGSIKAKKKLVLMKNILRPFYEDILKVFLTSLHQKGKNNNCHLYKSVNVFLMCSKNMHLYEYFNNIPKL